jgi:hypothetical protein
MTNSDAQPDSRFQIDADALIERCGKASVVELEVAWMLFTAGGIWAGGLQ